ncbi:hypothetical protein ACIBG7_00090 [Nonomuraea sp. NPDC050328]|uniref:hypothetical protein n=1 Tax=Nonomuraea sp. NPDC050328 TaxID=3364361 RepID=UPI003796969F
MLITRNSEALAVLSDPLRAPAPVEAGAPRGTLAWLRGQVSRFSSGAAHAERRAAVTAVLDRLDPHDLRKAAARLAHEPPERVAVLVLGAALGVEDLETLAGQVAAAARGYLSGEADAEADAAVAELIGRLPIAELTVLLQAHAATGALLAVAAGRDLDEVLRDDPPVRVLRREGVEIDVPAANQDGPCLTFGYGPRACPGQPHARAIAEGWLSR